MISSSVFVSKSAIMDADTGSYSKRNVFDKADLFASHVLSYELGALLWSLAKADGQPVKTTKSQLFHLLEKSASSLSDIPLNAALEEHWWHGVNIAVQ